MLKKVVSFIAGVACLVSMTGVFAANCTSTTTTYSGDKIEVTAYVTGNAGETVTYLVHKAASIDAVTSDDVVYIDQYKFSADKTEAPIFKYQASDAAIGASFVFGGAADNTGTIPDATHKVVDTEGNVLWRDNGFPDGDIKKFTLSGVNASSAITAVEINGASASDWFVSDGNEKVLYIADNLADVTEITVTMGGVAANAAETIDMTFLSAEEAADGESNASVVVTGKVAGDAAEFGIILGTSSEELKNVVNGVATNNAQALKALAKNNDGLFAIRVYDNANFEADDELYAVAYYKDATGAIVPAGTAYRVSIAK